MLPILQQDFIRESHLLELLPAAVYVCDLDGVIRLYNSKAAELWGRRPQCGDTDQKFCGAFRLHTVGGRHLPHDQTPMATAIRTGRAELNHEVVIERPDRSRITVLVNIAPLHDEDGKLIGAVNCFQDITERKRLESELDQYRQHLERLVDDRTQELSAAHESLRAAERLSSLGTLAAGLGHDANNLLFPVRACLQDLASENLPDSARETLDVINRCTDNLYRLTNGLRSLARNPGGRGEIQRTSLASWIREAEPILRTAVPAGVRLQIDFPSDLPPAAILDYRLTQASLNLIKNAVDAFASARTTDPTIRIGAHVLPDASAVSIQVSDNGPGMSSESRRRAAEPFYTTKTRGVSTGLGLSIVHGIALEVGGRLHIDSDLGRGTTVALIIPCDQNHVSAPATPPQDDSLLAATKAAAGAHG